MAYTDEAKVEKLFSGIDLDTGVVSTFIEDASEDVAGYDLTIQGSVARIDSSEIFDYGGHFTERGVTTSSTVWLGTYNYNTYQIERDWNSSGLISTTPTQVKTFSLVLSDASNFGQGDYFLVEDIARREKAERYRTASLIFDSLRTNEDTVKGLTEVDLGDASLRFGDADEIFNLKYNPFEKRFLAIVGHC